MLTQIAGITGGQYWRATDLDELIAIYDEIDQLERSEIDEIIYIDHEDLYPGYLGGGLLLIILAFINERVLTRSALFAEKSMHIIYNEQRGITCWIIYLLLSMSSFNLTLYLSY